jgi:hypothetical protein
MRTKISRAELVAALVARDGMSCQYPGCGEELDFEATGSKEVTIDHTEPQAWCRENGWTEDEIWDLSNLTLMHKRCNAKKSDLRYLPDGTLPVTNRSRFRYRRDKRAERPEICTSCSAGRDLGPDEVCASCGSGPQPERYPRWAKVPANECDHELFWCAWCSIGVIPRAGATEMIMLRGEGGE